MIRAAAQEDEDRRKHQLKEEKQAKEEERDNKMKDSFMALPEEPEEGSDDVCTISFRSADGTKNIKRRFLKYHKVKAMYDFINSLGEDAGFEQEHAEFEIIQNFPRTVFSDYSQTLEKA